MAQLFSSHEATTTTSTTTEQGIEYLDLERAAMEGEVVGISVLCRCLFSGHLWRILWVRNYGHIIHCQS